MSKKARAVHDLYGKNPSEQCTMCRNMLDKTVASDKIAFNKFGNTEADVRKLIDNTDEAAVKAKSGAKADQKALKENQRIMLDEYDYLKAFITREANKTLDPVSAITSCGFRAVMSLGGSGVKELTLTALGNGTVEISVPRAKSVAAFVYQYSLDGGKTWLFLDNSKLATYLLKGQTPGTTVFVRYANIGGTTESFSAAKSIMAI